MWGINFSNTFPSYFKTIEFNNLSRFLKLILIFMLFDNKTTAFSTVQWVLPSEIMNDAVMKYKSLKLSFVERMLLIHANQTDNEFLLE